MSDLNVSPISKDDQSGGCYGSSMFGLSQSFAGSDGFCPLASLDFTVLVSAGSGAGPDEDDDEGEEAFGLSSSPNRSASLRRWRFSSSASCPSSLPSLVPLIPAVGSADAGIAGGLGCLPDLGA